VNSVKTIWNVDLPLSTVTGDGKSDAVQRPRGFDTDASANIVYDALAAAYKQNARAVATQVIERADACIKTANAPQPCVETFVKAHAGPAFRRPIAAPELARWVTFYRTNATTFGATDAARMVVEAIAQSPHFLYRSELGPDGAPAGKPIPLTQHELATSRSPVEYAAFWKNSRAVVQLGLGRP
jgi:hypothetical protein